MIQALEKIWMDGQMVAWNDAKIPLLTHSFHYGLGAFEGIRAYKRADGKSAVFRLKEHIDRLFDSAKLVLMPMPFTKEQVMAACVDLLQVNKMSDGYLRPIAFIGEGAMGIFVNNPTRVAVVAWHWGAYLGSEALQNGIRGKISSFARHHINISLAKAKMMGQYTNSVLAKREAKLGGYDEAILLDTQGHVSEGSGENIFMVKHGALITPPLSASILAGITRETIITLAREEGIAVREEPITRDQLYLADECFFTGTAAEVTPVRQVDNRDIGEGKPGPVTRKLQERYFKLVRGEDTSHPEWLTTYSI